MTNSDLTFVPNIRDNYYVPCTSNPDFVVSYYVDPYGDDADKRDNEFHISNNLCYQYTNAGYTAAAKHGKQLLVGNANATGI